MKPKSFCTAKETINEVKRQSTDWEKVLIFVNDAIHEALISKTYKQLIQLSNKKNKQVNQKMGRNPK